ncbi:DUF4123 domain-containing protein [Stenotrophomonas rhizophila]|uniref:DUF4123 domain-containing protein n=1 Tax=Stenotrophomonas rhizophila TaxID=216778 RepID=UPI0010BFE25E|nr:DUF4123 domain-containing protein [Stenotrophomonas rhizophila]TKK09756.1 hypothetical protein SrhCFBP13529_06310 [Stenotrophomonas rhizophila]
MADDAAIPHRIFLESQYLIVNPMQVDPREWSQLESVSIVSTRLKHEAHMMPRLVSLDKLPLERKLELLDRNELSIAKGNGALWSCALRSDSSLDETAGHLARAQVLRTPHGQYFLLRHHDPRVFRHLIWMLRASQLAALMGPISVWSWLDADSGQWQQVARPQDRSGGGLVAQEWGGINRIGLVNAVLRDVRKARMDVALDESLYRQIDSALKRAIEIEGLGDAEDQRLYALHCIHYGDAWSERADVQAVLTRVKSGDGSYYALSVECTSLGASGALEKTEGNRHA